MKLKAVAVMLLFVVAFFAMPLYAAATLCVMPCCHQESAQPVVSAAMGCATECLVRADEATAATPIGVIAPQSVIAFTIMVVDATNITTTDRVPQREQAHAPPAASLQVLNSIFRI